MKKELKESISNLLGEEVTGEQITGLDCLLEYIDSLEERISNLEGGKEGISSFSNKKFLFGDSPMEKLTAKKIGDIEYPSTLQLKMQKASDTLYGKASKNANKSKFKISQRSRTQG